MVVLFRIHSSVTGSLWLAFPSSTELTVVTRKLLCLDHLRSNCTRMVVFLSWFLYHLVSIVFIVIALIYGMPFSQCEIATSGQDAAPYWGWYTCDPPIWTVENLFQHINETDEVRLHCFVSLSLSLALSFPFLSVPLLLLPPSFSPSPTHLLSSILLHWCCVKWYAVFSCLVWLDLLDRGQPFAWWLDRNSKGFSLCHGHSDVLF